MAPVEVLKDKPAGTVGLMLKELAEPVGETVGVAVVMEVPETPVIVLGEYETLDIVTAARQGTRDGILIYWIRSYVPTLCCSDNLPAVPTRGGTIPFLKSYGNQSQITIAGENERKWLRCVQSFPILLRSST